MAKKKPFVVPPIFEIVKSDRVPGANQKFSEDKEPTPEESRTHFQSLLANAARHTASGQMQCGCVITVVVDANGKFDVEFGGMGRDTDLLRMAQMLLHHVNPNAQLIVVPQGDDGKEENESPTATRH